jgi:CBS domain-containing protein
MSELLAEDVMESKVISVNSENNLKEVLGVLTENRISGVPVEDADGILVGVLSQSDILHYVTEDERWLRDERAFYLGDPFWDSSLFVDSTEKLEEAKAYEVMNCDVVSVGPKVRISDIAITMRRHRIHRVIVTENGVAVGIISALDLIKVLENH